MRPKILLTSFQPWLAHHLSNSSDDLLAEWQTQPFSAGDRIFLRQLPVHAEQASQATLKAIATHRPDGIVCCGMAESRECLTIESQASFQGQNLCTSLDLQALTMGLRFTEISHDAGKFVCETLYFHVLQHLAQVKPHVWAVFVHVPVLTHNKRWLILQEFHQMLQTLCTVTAQSGRKFL